MKKNLVVLTCTVRPTNTSLVKRYDPVVRLQDYTLAIKKWIKLTVQNNFDLLIIENSDSLNLIMNNLDFEESRNLKFKIANPAALSDQEGISTGEFYMLKNILAEEIPKYDFIWKSSGRNFPNNAMKLITGYPGIDIVVERNLRPVFSADSRLFGMKAALWSQFLSSEPSFIRHNQSFMDSTFESMEHLLTMFVTDAGFHGSKVSPFKEFPIFQEKSGTLDKSIMSRRRRIILKILGKQRKILSRISSGFVS